MIPMRFGGSSLYVNRWRSLSYGVLGCVLTGAISGAVEEISPQPQSLAQQNLSYNSVPENTFEQMDLGEAETFVPLFRFAEPLFKNLTEEQAGSDLASPDPSDFREIIAYKPPQGLMPPETIQRLFVLRPFAGLAESYDSNIEQTPTHHIAASFTTLRLGADLQLGSPDSMTEGYDTILALNAHYEFFPDIFTTQSQFNSINQQLKLEGRIGRSDFIWRPFFTAEDITGGNLLTVERVGRTERKKLITGFHGDYKLTPVLTWSQTFSHLFFEHPDRSYINFNVFQDNEELVYHVSPDFNLIGWGEYRDTGVDRGADGQEVIGGAGCRGKIAAKLAGEALLGWDALHLDQPQPGRVDLSGVYVASRLTYDYSARLRLILEYNRNYTFNELGTNDNYMGNTLQFGPQVFFGGNWYVTPYVGVSYDQFETSRQETLEVRPELEVAYMLPNSSRVFVKVGYDDATIVKGSGLPTVIYRMATGINWRF